MIRLPLSVILLPFSEMTWNWSSRYPNQAVFSPTFLPPERWNGTYQSTPISALASLLVISPFIFFKIPQVTVVRHLGVPLGTTFTSSAHCREAANAAGRLLSMLRRSLTELPKYCKPRLFMLPLPLNSDQFMPSLLPPATNPTITKNWPILCIPQTPSPHCVVISTLILIMLVFYNRQILDYPTCLLDAA